MLVSITIDVDKISLFRTLDRIRNLGVDITLVGVDGVDPMIVTADTPVADICEYYQANES